MFDTEKIISHRRRWRIPKEVVDINKKKFSKIIFHFLPVSIYIEVFSSHQSVELPLVCPPHCQEPIIPANTGQWTCCSSNAICMNDISSQLTMLYWACCPKYVENNVVLDMLNKVCWVQCCCGVELDFLVPSRDVEPDISCERSVVLSTIP